MKHLLALLLSCKEKGVRIHTDPAGNNLKISGQVGLLSEEEKTALKVNKEGIILMLKGKEKSSSTIPQTGVQEDYELSFSQKRIWLMSQLEEGNIAHNIFLVKDLSGNLQTGQLELALKSLLNRHEILRTVFIVNEEGEPKQFIRNSEDCNVEILHSDLRNIENPDMPDLLGQCASIPFDLVNGPLFRPVLFRLAEDKWIFVFVMHHIISDAWSMDVVINELLYYYHVHGNEVPDSRPDLMIHYKDYAAWQRQQLEAALTSYKSYWLKQFKGALPVLELTTDKIRPAIKTNEGGSVISFVDQRTVEKIKLLSHEHGGTLFTGLLTAVYILLYKYTEQEDIIIGTPVSSRSHVDLENQIGIYLNTLALRIIFSKTESYRQLSAKVSDTSMEAFKYQEYPFEALVEELNLPYDKSRNPLFDVMVTLQQDKEGKGIAQKTPDDLIISNYTGDVVVPNNKFDLVLTFTESEDMLTAHFEYNSAIFHRETMERFASRFSFVLEQLSNKPDVSIERISLFDELEKQRMLKQVTSAAAPFPKGQCILSLFDKQVQLSPDNTAIFYEGTTFTYRTLNELSNQFSAYLRLSAHLQPGELAGINLPRTAWVVAAILGVLKSGATYLPIDHNTPAERIDYMINDSCCRLVIDEALLTDFLLKQHDFDIADIPSSRSLSTPVYVIYTSGSTGNPKGVVVHNDALVNLCYWHIDAFSVNNEDRATLYAGLGFDAAVWELFPYLLTGAGLFMVPEEIRLDMEKLRAYMELHQVSIAFLPTQIAEQFMQADHSSLRHLLVGGDRLKSFTKQKYQVTNNYGPTENTVVSTSFLVSEYLPNIPIGKPIANVNIYVVNGSNEICPVDIPGEICIAGSGLSSGYLNNPELTTEKFVPNLFHHEGMLYKTGDYGRWLPSGNLEFLGRKDNQVKIRGNRVELGEIESVLNTYEGLLEVAVIATDANDFGERELIACFVGEETVSVPVLKAFLAEKLPAYMIPGYYVQLASMPLNQNGKIDRQYLAGNTESYIGAGLVYVAPADELEKELAGIWGLVLGRKEISANDDFFLLGGNSLKAMRLIGMMQRSFKIKIGLKNIFDHSVLTDQALFIRKNLQTKYLGIVPTSPNPHYPLSSSQRRLWLLSQFSDTSIAYHISDIHVYEAELDIAALTAAFSALIERHESLRTVFKEDEYGNVFQYIRLPEEVDFQISTAVLEIGNSLGDIVEKIRQQPFDLAADTLLRAGVIRISADKWVIVTVMHHIVSDGWSMEILNRELLLFYQSEISGNAYRPEALSIHYKDYAVWQQDLLNTDIMAGSRTYWLNQFSENIPVFLLHGDYNRPAIKTHNGGVVRKNINAATAKQLIRFSKERGCTLYMTLLSLVSALLYKYTSEEDIVIGSPIAGREHESLEDQIGCYLNTLAMRMRFSGKDNFSMLLTATKKLTLDAYEHQSFPFDELVNLLPLQQDRSRSALFNVMMLLAENNVQEKPGNASLSLYQEELKVASKFDLTFSFQELGEELQLSLIYNSDIYSEGRVSAMCTHLEQLASAVLRFPEVALKNLDFLTAEEQSALMGHWPVAGAHVGDQDTVVSLFEDQEKRTPLAIALVFEEHSLSYSALNAQANRLGHYLRSEYGLLADDLVGICLERSHWSLVAMLGILKSGGAYVHIDTEYPQDRIDYMLADSGCKVLIDAQELAKFLLLEGNYPSSNPVRANRSADLAYVIYTSGST
ncbi:non-ribosomal peptide synthetase, partial [Pedobacter alluvionis]